jgi:DNA polymerase-3 subunit epsilon
MFDALRRSWWQRRLRDDRFVWLAGPDRTGELVSIDCETSGLDVASAELLSVAAIRIAGSRILTSERLELVVRPERPPDHGNVLIHQLRPIDVAGGVPIDEAIEQVLRFIGARPLVGYFLKFDVAMLNKYVRPRLGVPLPNRQIEVSGMYYDAKRRRLPLGSDIDLRFSSIRQDLGLPERAEHDAFNDALLTAMMYLRLKGPDAGLV